MSTLMQIIQEFPLKRLEDLSLMICDSRIRIFHNRTHTKANSITDHSTHDNTFRLNVFRTCLSLESRLSRLF